MDQLGEITGIFDHKARVKIRRHQQCQKCHGCTGKKEIEVLAHNPMGAKVGEVVRLEMASGKLLGASFLVYLFPLLMILLGYLLGSSLATTEEELIGFLTGISFLIISFLLIRFIDDFLGKRRDYSPTITQIIGGE